MSDTPVRTRIIILVSSTSFDCSSFGRFFFFCWTSSYRLLHQHKEQDPFFAACYKTENLLVLMAFGKLIVPILITSSEHLVGKCEEYVIFWKRPIAHTYLVNSKWWFVFITLKDDKFTAKADLNCKIVCLHLAIKLNKENVTHLCYEYSLRKEKAPSS